MPSFQTLEDHGLGDQFWVELQGPLACCLALEEAQQPGSVVQVAAHTRHLQQAVCCNMQTTELGLLSRTSCPGQPQGDWYYFFVHQKGLGQQAWLHVQKLPSRSAEGLGGVLILIVKANQDLPGQQYPDVSSLGLIVLEQAWKAAHRSHLDALSPCALNPKLPRQGC